MSTVAFFDDSLSGKLHPSKCETSRVELLCFHSEAVVGKCLLTNLGLFLASRSSSVWSVAAKKPPDFQTQWSVTESESGFEVSQV